MDEPIVIARFFDVRQAELAASVLDGDGIKSFIDQPFTGSIAPHYVIGSGGIRLFVAAEDGERASEVLRAFEQTEVQAGGQDHDASGDDQ